MNNSDSFCLNYPFFCDGTFLFLCSNFGERERERERERDRQTDRQTDRHIGRQRKKVREGERGREWEIFLTVVIF